MPADATTRQHLQRLLKASERVKRAEGNLDDARENLRAVMRAALAAGVSQTAMADTLGVSRQRVSAMLKSN